MRIETRGVSNEIVEVTLQRRNARYFSAEHIENRIFRVSIEVQNESLRIGVRRYVIDQCRRDFCHF